MAKYIVYVREVWVQAYAIEADSLEEASQGVEDGLGDVLNGDYEYSHQLDPETWTVEPFEESPYADNEPEE